MIEGVRKRPSVIAPLAVAAALMLLMSFAAAFHPVYAENENGTSGAASSDESGDGGASDAGKYSKPPKLVAKSAILINAKTGEVLYEKKADKRRAPASCTKIMTALLAIENLDPNEKVAITNASAGTEGSSVGLMAGEKVKADELIYAALLESGNDAASALAVGVDGSIAQFAERMNERAAELGLSKSHFMNPHGLDDPDHYTTARELGVIAREAMKNERFREYVSTYEHVMPKTNKATKRYLHNSNRLIFDNITVMNVYGETIPTKYPDITGIKTGFTDQAGNCLVSGMKRDGMELISVVLFSQGVNQYADSVSLLEYGMHNFSEVTYAKKGDKMFEQQVEGSDRSSVNLVLAEDLVTTVGKDSGADNVVESDVSGATTSGSLIAPVKAGDKYGTACVKSPDGQMLAQVDIVAESYAAAKGDSGSWGLPDVDDDGVGVASLILQIAVVAVLVAVVLVVIAVVKSAAARRKRRANRMYGAKLKESVDPREVRRIKSINKPRRGRY